MKGKNSSQQSIFVSKIGSNVFNGLEWIIMDNLPFQFVERALTRKMTKLEPITDETLKEHLQIVTKRFEKESYRWPCRKVWYHD